MGMFKNSSFETELAKTMEKSLVTSQLENQYSFNKVSKAADYINAAAELLDDTGFSKEAETLTKIIEKLAHNEDGFFTDDEDLEELFNRLNSLPIDKKQNILNRLSYEMSDPNRSNINEEIIVDPLDQEIKSDIEEDMENPYLEYKSLAEVVQNITNKYAKKKV